MLFLIFNICFNPSKVRYKLEMAETIMSVAYGVSIPQKVRYKHQNPESKYTIHYTGFNPSKVRYKP